MNRFVKIGKRFYNVSNIVSVFYDTDTQEFFVHTVDGNEYIARGVSRDVFKSLMLSLSAEQRKLPRPRWRWEN